MERSPLSKAAKGVADALEEGLRERLLHFLKTRESKPKGKKKS
jgi:hypothetical protein